MRYLRTTKNKNLKVFQRVFLIFSFVLMVITMVLPPDTGGLPAGFGPSKVDAQAAATCPNMVKKALTTVSGRCNNTARNNACYGNGSLEVEAQQGVTDFKFSNPGDKAQLTTIRSLKLGALDTAAQTWGIALLRLQANLPDTVRGQNVTMLMFGDVEITDNAQAASLTQATIEGATLTPLAATVVANDTEQAPTRLAEQTKLWEPARARETVRAGTVQAQADNRDATSQARAEQQNPTQQARATVQDATADTRATNQSGTAKARATLLTENQQTRVANIRATQNVPPSPTVYKPMQAFYFRSGIGDVACNEAPRDGMLIQSPQGPYRITLSINDVKIELGSTAFFQAQAGAHLIVSTLEGTATASSFGVTEAAVAGQRVRIPLDANLRASGPPLPPEPYNDADMAALPVRNMPQRITIIPSVGNRGPESLVSSAVGEACIKGGVTIGVSNPAGIGYIDVGEYAGGTWTAKAGTTVTFQASGQLFVQSGWWNYIALTGTNPNPAAAADAAAFAKARGGASLTYTFPKDREKFFVAIGMRSPGTATLKVTCDHVESGRASPAPTLTATGSGSSSRSPGR